MGGGTLKRAVTMGLLGAVAATLAAAAGSAGASPAVGKISHVVLIYQENHSFDNVLGAWCVKTAHCNGATTGPGGPLGPLPDDVPNMGHNTGDQQNALAGNWLKVSLCKIRNECLAQYQQAQVPAITAMAGTFALSDNTFASAPVPSAGAHLLLATATLDGFQGNNPGGQNAAHGWGCASGLQGPWSPSGQPPYQLEPFCIPYTSPSGQVPAGSPVKHVDSIFDRMAAAGVSWTIYGAINSTWGPCSYLADCYYTSQAQHVVNTATKVINDATAGTLPAVSIVIPSYTNSQHNLQSMITGDNWLASVVNAVESGPDWASTAVMITYDDCGCFYDHVQPPAGTGFRVPFVLVSPFAKAGYVDHTQGTFFSILAMIEKTFGLTPLNLSDAGAYDYHNMINLNQAPIRPQRLPTQPASVLAPQTTQTLDPGDT
jgi:phospholipase C